MAAFSLTPPEPVDLADWKQLDGVDELDAPYDSVLVFLQLSADLLTLATGATREPDPNTPIGRLVKIAMLDMAWYLGTSMEDRDAMFSPFSSERIGSYVYSRAAKAVQSNSETGVPFFDLVLKYWKTGLGDDSTRLGLPSISSESVFHSPFGSGVLGSPPDPSGLGWVSHA